jgi:hypothetical protein
VPVFFSLVVRGLSALVMPPKKHQSKSERMSKSSKGSVGLDTGFISFSDVLNNEVVSSVKANGPTPVYTGNDPELMVISKKLSKKNSSTRNKALSELKTIVEDKIEIISPEFIGFFVFIYERLLLDNDRYVRQETNTIFSLLLKFDRRQFKHFIPAIVGPMWISTCDVVQEVSRSAEEVLESTFPNSEKRVESLSVNFGHLIRYIGGNISSSPETLSDMSSTSAEEADERYERVVASALLSFAKLIAFFPQDILEQSSIAKLIRDRILPFSNHSRHEFRKAVFRIFINLCEQKPSIISSNTFENQLSTILIRSLSTERTSGTVAIMLHSVISFLKAFPSSFEKIDLASSVFPQIQELLLSSPDLCLPALLPLISTISLERLVANGDALMTLLNSVNELSERIKDATTPWITSAEISTFLVIRFLKMSACSNDEHASTLFSQILENLTESLVTLMDQNQSFLAAPLILHLHKQTLTLKDQNYSHSKWDQSLAKSIHRRLLETVHLGISGSFVKSLDSIISLLSGVSQIDYSNLEVGEKDLGCFFILHSIFRLADTHCRVLSSVLTHQSYEALEGFMLWGSTGLKIGNILLDIVRSHPHILSITSEDLLSFIDLNNYYLCLHAFYDRSRSHSDSGSQFRYSLNMSRDLHVFLLKIASLENLSSSESILSAVISIATQKQSLLWAMLLVKDNVITSWDQLTLLENRIPTVSWLNNEIQNRESSQEYPLSLQIALALCCKLKGITPPSGQVESAIDMWVEISEYHQSLDRSILPNKYITSCFQRAFFLKNASEDQCRVLSDEFKIISSWNDLRRLRFPDSHAKHFVLTISSTLKGVLSDVTYSCPAIELNATTFYSHFTRLLEQVQIGCLQSVGERVVYEEIGIFHLEYWNQLYRSTTELFGSEGGDHADRISSLRLAVQILKLYFSRLASVAIDPTVCFQILRTLTLLQSSEQWTKDSDQKLDLENVTNHTILCLVANRSPWLLRKLFFDGLSLLSSLTRKAEIDAVFFPCSQLVEYGSVR